MWKFGRIEAPIVLLKLNTRNLVQLLFDFQLPSHTLNDIGSEQRNLSLYQTS